MNRTALPWPTDRATRSMCRSVILQPPGTSTLGGFLLPASGLARSGNSTLVTGAGGLCPPSSSQSAHLSRRPSFTWRRLFAPKTRSRLREGPAGRAALPSNQVGRPCRTVVASPQSPGSIGVGREDPLGGRCQPDASTNQAAAPFFSRAPARYPGGRGGTGHPLYVTVRSPHPA